MPYQTYADDYMDDSARECDQQEYLIQKMIEIRNATLLKLEITAETGEQYYELFDEGEADIIELFDVLSQLEIESLSAELSEFAMKLAEQKFLR